MIDWRHTRCCPALLLGVASLFFVACAGSRSADKLSSEESGKTSIRRPRQFERLTDNTNWLLTHWSVDEAVYEEIEITLRVEGNQISGKSACNTYRAEFGEPETGAIDISITTRTKMLCDDPFTHAEMRFFDILRRVDSYEVVETRETSGGEEAVIERLRLAYPVNSHHDTLIFEAIPSMWETE